MTAKGKRAILRSTRGLMTLQEYLIEHGMTAKEFAKKCGVSYTTIKMVRRGQLVKLYAVAKMISAATGGAVEVSDVCEPGTEIEE